MSAPSIVWLGPLHDPSGYSDEARGFLRALELGGAEPTAVATSSVGADAGLIPSDAEMLLRQGRRPPRAPIVAVHHYVPGHRQPAIENAVNVARVMFETDSVPPAWLPMLDFRDEIWVPSEHNFESFARAGVAEEKLKVLGGTIDFELFQPGAPPYGLDVPAGSFVFLTNFDFSERKAWKQLLHAWARAFEPTDPVCLLLKTGSYWWNDGTVRDKIESYVRSEIGGFERLAPLRIFTDILPAADLPRLYAAADAYVLASRGEGWGRPYMEAMAMGLPTIASGWSGNLAFMNEGNSWLVGGKLIPVPDDADLINNLYRGHRWFEPDVDEVAAALREIASDPAAARAKAAGARDELIERFGPVATAERVLELAGAASRQHAAHPPSTHVDRGAARRACQIEGARTIGVLAFGPELVDSPELLRAWGERFGAADDVTLVIYSPGADAAEIEGGLLAAAAAAGLDGDDTADLLALPLGDRVSDERLLAASVDALLSGGDPGAPFASLPRFGATTLDGIGALASRTAAAGR